MSLKFTKKFTHLIFNILKQQKLITDQKKFSLLRFRFFLQIGNSAIQLWKSFKKDKNTFI